MKNCIVTLIWLSLVYFKFSNCVSEAELMTMSIGHLHHGVYPYTLHDEDALQDCIRKETLEKHNKNNSAWDVWSTVNCFIQLSKERYQGLNSIKIYESKNEKNVISTEGLLDKYCSKWTPTVDTCFEATTSVLNDCNANELDKGYKSLYFAAAFMSYICKDKNKTLDNIVRTSETEVSLTCFSELQDDIFACVRTKKAKSNSTDFCTNYGIAKSCFKIHYETVSEENCNSTRNYTGSKAYMMSLLEYISNNLCKEPNTMNKKLEEHTAAKRTDRTGKNNGEKISFALGIVAFTSYALIFCTNFHSRI